MREVDAKRRQFLVRAVPACAATCLALRGTLAASSPEAPGQGSGQAAPAKHKFDIEYPAKLTYRQLFQVQYGSTLIPLVRVLKKSLGQEKTLALLTEMTTDGSRQQAQAVARQLGGNDLATVKKLFSRPLLASVCTTEVVRDTETTYELRVTECLWASTFRQADLAAEGYAAVCLGDFALVQALNPKITLQRDKTLMQGHDCCNHCYTTKG